MIRLEAVELTLPSSAGLAQATGGRIEVAGSDLATLDEDQLARFRRKSGGIVLQNFHLLPTMTALENVAVPLEFAGRGDAFARAESSLRQVGLGRRLTHYPGQLSGGKQQRVGLAGAFSPESDLLLTDGRIVDHGHVPAAAGS